MLYTLFQDYVLQPTVDLATCYVVAPVVDFAKKQFIAVATKTVASKATAVLVNPLLPELNQQDLAVEPAEGMQISDSSIDSLQKLTSKAQTFATGIVYENATQMGLKGLELVAPVSKPVTYLLPRAIRIAATQNSPQDPLEEIVVGALSHGAGTFAQHNVDSLLPQFAPYGGYIAYGITNGMTSTGLDRVARLMK